jgi:hypothetical protein
MKSCFGFHASWPAVLAAVVGTVLLSGCACGPGKLGGTRAYNLQIKLDESLKDSSVVVDVIPANSSDLERLKTYSINKYWKPDDTLRQDLSKTHFSFVSSGRLQCTLPAKDPKWKQWKKDGVQYLVIIADLPGVFDDGKSGSQDPRRQLLPICKCYWKSWTRSLPVEIQASGVRVLAVPREGQALPPGW